MTDLKTQLSAIHQHIINEQSDRDATKDSFVIHRKNEAINKANFEAKKVQLNIDLDDAEELAKLELEDELEADF